MRSLHPISSYQNSSSSSSSINNIFFSSASKNSPKCSFCHRNKNITLPISSFSPLMHFPAYSIIFSSAPSKPITQSSPNLLLQTSGLCSSSNSTAAVVVDEVEEKETTSVAKSRVLKEKIWAHGLSWDDSCIPGQYTCLLCPKCRGGKSIERSLSLHVNLKGDFAMWRCFRAACGWAGQAYADERVAFGRNQLDERKFSGQMTEKSLGLESLGRKLISYFAQRMISEETLQRNLVMQMARDQSVIAFAYRQNGELVGCKYRTIEKRFWQERGTEKVLYGLDDIRGADEIIIVEGEMDKLSVEEAGFRNCVSVPGGAPQKVSTKELPALEKDPAYQYLWNSKEHFEKASRIILATDGDTPGQALAEELARRLGKERCSQVIWPKKDDHSCFKDANEVLINLGKDALKEVIETARLCWAHSSN